MYTLLQNCQSAVIIHTVITTWEITFIYELNIYMVVQPNLIIRSIDTCHADVLLTKYEIHIYALNHFVARSSADMVLTGYSDLNSRSIE